MTDLLQIIKDFDQSDQALRILEEQAAEAEAIFRQLDCQTRSMLGRAFQNTRANTVKEREMLALTDENYLLHLKAVEEARATYLRIGSHLKAARSRFKYCQSIISLKKAEMNIL